MTQENGSNGQALAVVESTASEVSAFGNAASFATAQRVATALANSTVVPADYRKNIPNVLVAMEYANRLGASVLAVMQNLDVIHGRPALRATFLIGTVNATKRFSPIRYRWEGEEGKDTWGCRAWAKDRESGEECVGPLITIGLAKAEGWYGKAGSKWKTIPELMMMYRAGAWWTRVFCPELSLGIQTSDEVYDIGPSSEDRIQTAAAALDEPQTIPGIPVEDENDTGPASAGQLQQLEELREKAREAEAMTVELEEQVEEALKLKDGPGVSAAMKGLNRALLATADAGQGDLGMEG